MRVVASLLMLVVLLHCACMGRCMGEEAISLATATPPCHQHGGEESPEPNSNLCSEGPSLEAKTSPVMKCALEVVDVPCVATAPALSLSLTSHSDFLVRFEPVSPALLQVTVLRI